MFGVKWALRASWHRPTAGRAFPGILVSQVRQLWTMAGASPHMDEGKGWDWLHQQAAKPQLSLQMETVPTERTLLKAVPGSQDVGVVPIQILPSLPVLSPLPLLAAPCSKATLRAEPRELHPPWAAETQETAAQCL